MIFGGLGLSDMRKPRKTMRQQCEFETGRIPVAVLCHDAAAPGAAEPEIDLDRVVWDPEYRSEVLETLRDAG